MPRFISCPLSRAPLFLLSLQKSKPSLPRMSKSSCSTGSSSSIRNRVVGVPTICWCGAGIVVKVSKSEANPYRRYYRCGHASANKLMDDTHVFKWVDDALLNEVEKLKSKSERLEQLIRENEIVFDGSDYEKVVFEKVEVMLHEGLASLKKKMILVVVACMIIVALSKLL